jgi:hypothetical protein
MANEVFIEFAACKNFNISFLQARRTKKTLFNQNSSLQKSKYFSFCRLKSLEEDYYLVFTNKL